MCECVCVSQILDIAWEKNTWANRMCQSVNWTLDCVSFFFFAHIFWLFFRVITLGQGMCSSTIGKRKIEDE